MSLLNKDLKDNLILKRGITSWAIKGVLYKAYVAVVLMVSAGRWNWWAGWLYVFIFLMFDLATALLVIPKDPSLLIERAKSHSDVKSWDKVIMPLAAGVLPLVGWILAGLNLRWNWNPPMDRSWQLIGFLLTILGHAVVAWAMSANAFFSPLVRIQEERGHQVADTGPYRLIRHPGYLGAIVFTIGVPILLGSWWALIPNLIAAVLYIIRTALEDQTLIEELQGYAEYASRVKYKLIPGAW
jgi:protein-S-isoprenylcysteine O-methyltransferase Ste14